MLIKSLIYIFLLTNIHTIALAGKDHAMGCTEQPIRNISPSKALDYLFAVFNNPQDYTGFFTHHTDTSQHSGDFTLKLQTPICIKFRYTQPHILQIAKKSNCIFYKIGDFNRQSQHYHKSRMRKMHLSSVLQKIFIDDSWISKITIIAAQLQNHTLDITFILMKQEITLTIDIKTKKLLGWYFTDPKTGRNFIKLYYHTHDNQIYNYDFE